MPMSYPSDFLDLVTNNCVNLCARLRITISALESVLRAIAGPFNE